MFFLREALAWLARTTDPRRYRLPAGICDRWKRLRRVRHAVGRGDRADARL